MKVLQISAHFLPNLGGIETHLSDLAYALVKRKWKVFILTYQPLTTKASWKIYENGDSLQVLRIPWVAGLFYKFIHNPFLEFLYLFPGLFFVTPFLILAFNPQVINGHGLVAGFVCVFWGKIFGKKTIVSTHSIYHFPVKGLYRNFARWIFNNASISLGLSKHAVEEIRAIGLLNNRVDSFTYWIDLKKFQVKRKIGLKHRFTVLFVGRLVEEKGINGLLQSVREWNSNINLSIIGTGPLEYRVKEAAMSNTNIKYMGAVDQSKLPFYYNASDILIVPSTSEEGFGRVILEALASGLPVIGANRGAIPEAMDETVGKLIDITPKTIKNAVEYFYLHQDELSKLSKKCRGFAERRYSEENVETIIKAYLG